MYDGESLQMVGIVTSTRGFARVLEHVYSCCHLNSVTRQFAEQMSVIDW